jgi:hypothetical protein
VATSLDTFPMALVAITFLLALVTGRHFIFGTFHFIMFVVFGTLGLDTFLGLLVVSNTRGGGTGRYTLGFLFDTFSCFVM